MNEKEKKVNDLIQIKDGIGCFTIIPKDAIAKVRIWDGVEENWEDSKMTHTLMINLKYDLDANGKAIFVDVFFSNSDHNEIMNTKWMGCMAVEIVYPSKKEAIAAIGKIVEKCNL